MNNRGVDRAATDEDTKKTVRTAAKWLDGTVMSVTEDVPLDILSDLNAARMKLTSGDAWQFYKRLADKWGTKNFSPSVKERWQYTGVFNSTGWPATVVRCGSSADGKLPIGVQVVAAPWRDNITLAVASFLESKSGGWKAPPI